MSKTADGTRQVTLADLPTAEADESAASGDGSEESTQTPSEETPDDLAALADAAGTTTTTQRERGDRAADDAGRDTAARLAEEDRQLRRATIADSGINNRRGLQR